MKKKILMPILALAMMVTAGINYEKISSSVNDSEISLSMLVTDAHATNEYGDNDWDNVEDFLNWLDSLGGHDGTELNGDVCDELESFCDFYDLTGDPEFDWLTSPNGTVAFGQVDDCDGQPNIC